MKLRDVLRKLIEMPIGEPAARERPIQQTGLIELPHLQCILEHRPLVADPRTSALPADRQHGEIEIGGEPTIEPQLLLAIVPSFFQRGEIQKA
jgi:hypothetical protein